MANQSPWAFSSGLVQVVVSGTRRRFTLISLFNHTAPAHSRYYRKVLTPSSAGVILRRRRITFGDRHQRLSREQRWMGSAAYRPSRKSVAFQPSRRLSRTGCSAHAQRDPRRRDRASGEPGEQLCSRYDDTPLFTRTLTSRRPSCEVPQY